MTELYIEDKNGNYQLVDLTESVIMNYETNNIAELQHRKANYSLEIKIPKSKNNCQIFDNLQINDIVTDFPYRKHNCRLYRNGYTIAGQGSYLKCIEEDFHYFSFQILSGIADAFTAMKETKLSDINLGGIEWNVNGVVSSDIQRSRIIYGYSEFSKNGEYLTIDRNGNFFSRFAFPFARLTETVKDAVGLCGYYLVDDVPKRQQIECLRIGTYQKSDNSFDPLNGSGTAGETLELNSGDSQMALIRGNAQFTSGLGRFFEYKTYNDITLEGYVQMNAYGTSPFIMQIYKDGELVRQVNSQYDIIAQRNYIKYKVNLDTFGLVDGEEHHYFSLESNQTMKMELGLWYPFNTGTTNTIQYTTTAFIGDVRYLNEDEQSVPYGGIIPVGKNLGFDTVFDLFKFYLQLYGLTAYVDNRDSVIYAYSFDALYSNKSKAFDWTGKVHFRSEKVDFTLRNYAVNNHINLKENSNGVQQSATFTVDNNTLKMDANLFELPIKSAQEVIRNQLTVVNIDDIEIEISDDKKEYNIDNKTAVCVSMNNDDTMQVSVYYDTVENIPPRYATIGVMKKMDIQNIVNVYYDKLITRMLNKAKVVELELLLTDEDIDIYNRIVENMPNCFIPIYLQQFGKYFYINKIGNFRGNTSLTRIELVKM